MGAELIIHSLSSDVDAVRDISDEIDGSLRGAAYADREIFAIKLALEEALVNAIRHGNQMDPDKQVFVGYTVTPERFEIRIADQGEGFDHESEFAPPSPTDPHILTATSCGRGLLLMRFFMTEVQFHGNGNCVSMAKVRGENS